jgi:hypothetical protein
MTWASVLFAGWLTLAWLPTGGLELYSNPVPEVLTIDGSFYTELGVEATWGLFFTGGAIKTPVWHIAETDTFWPTQAEYTVDAGVKWKELRLGWAHTCFHGVVPYTGTLHWIGRQVVPKWDGAYDAIYLTIGRKP